MKIKKSLLIISIILISLFVIGAASASDDVANVTAASDDNDIQAIDNDLADDASELQAEDADELQAEDTDELQSADGKDVLAEIEPEMNITANEVVYGKNAIIEVSVADKNDPSTDFNNTIVSLFCDDKFLDNVTLNSTGKYSYVIPEIYDVGTYHIFALMNTTFAQTMLKINKATPIVTVNDVESVYGNIVKIPFTVKDENGNGINGSAIVTIHWSNDVISKRVAVKNGQADVKFDISDLLGIFSGSGTNGTSFNFTGSFGNRTNGTKFNFTAMFGENGTFNITALLNGTGTNTTFDFKNLTNATFNFTNLFNFNKTVSFAYVLDVGTYNLTVTYLPDRNYEEANDTAKLIITYDKDVVYICEIASPEKYGDDTNVKVIVLDKYGDPISNATIFVTLNGIDKGNVTLDENGTASFTIQLLTNGNYELMISYNGTNDTFNFTVEVPMKTVITSKDISISTVNVAVDGETGKYLSVTLMDESNAVLANKSVLIAIDGKINNVTTDDSGVAKLQLNIAKAGVYTASICFLDEGVYSSSFNIAKVKVNKQTAKLTTKNAKYKAKAKTKKLTATFKSAKGKAIKGKKIAFTVKGKTYSAKTNAKGVATVKVKITKKGTYKFTAKFAGDDTYNAISKKAKLVLK